MNDFKKELQTLLIKYPEVEDISYTIKQTQTVKRENPPIFGQPVVHFNLSGKDEGALMDAEAKVNLEKIKKFITPNEQY